MELPGHVPQGDQHSHPARALGEWETDSFLLLHVLISNVLWAPEKLEPGYKIALRWLTHAHTPSCLSHFSTEPFLLIVHKEPSVQTCWVALSADGLFVGG